MPAFAPDDSSLFDVPVGCDVSVDVSEACMFQPDREYAVSKTLPSEMDEVFVVHFVLDFESVSVIRIAYSGF